MIDSQRITGAPEGIPSLLVRHHRLAMMVLEQAKAINDLCDDVEALRLELFEARAELAILRAKTP